jgi:aspartyl-tRNA(Asn)/glutamyl-tRNA(Gln) amidotransferase subunit A
LTPNDFIYLSASELSRLIAKRRLSPVELTAAYLQRIEELEPRLNAFITIMGDEAMAEAKRAESQIARGGYLGPMHGLPVAVKDQLWTQGVLTTSGSKFLKDFIPKEDATVVSRLKKAGVIIIGKTNLNEFALSGGYNFPWGIPRNPWDLTRLAGGSSYGSASATVTYMCATSIGEDTLGSIRSPSSMCSLVGLRPTWGRVSRHGLIGSSWSQDMIGPMSRTVEDCAMTLQPIAGYDSKDPYTWDTPVPDYSASLKDGVKGLRIGLVKEQVYNDRLNKDTQKGVLEAASVFKSLGGAVSEVSIPFVKYTGAIATAITEADGAAVHYERLRRHPRVFDPKMRLYLLAASLVPAKTYYKAVRLREMWRREFMEVMKRFDVLIGPTTASPAPLVASSLRMGSKADNKAEIAFGRILRSPVNLAGAAALSVPCGFTTNGLPFGLQVIGRPFDEAIILRVAYAYEQATEWHRRRPPIA